MKHTHPHYPPCIEGTTAPDSQSPLISHGSGNAPSLNSSTTIPGLKPGDIYVHRMALLAIQARQLHEDIEDLLEHYNADAWVGEVPAIVGAGKP